MRTTDRAASTLTLALTLTKAGSQQPSGGLAYGRSRRIDFLESAVHGSLVGHLLCLRIAERLRRIAAQAVALG